MGLAKGKLEALLFHVYDRKDDTRLTTEPISLLAPSGSGRSVTHTCQMVGGGCKENTEFGAILRKFELDHPKALPFNQTRFTLEEDDEGRWVHKPKSTKKKQLGLGPFPLRAGEQVHWRQADISSGTLNRNKNRGSYCAIKSGLPG